MKYNRLTVIENAGYNRHHQRMVKVSCECGTVKVILENEVKNGYTKSCGCLRRETTSKSTRTHGATRQGNMPTEYRSWQGMKTRCDNPNQRSYKHYGARGIKVCDRWRDYATFISDMGPKPSPDYTIERMDVNGDYTPTNCCWATRTTQARNKRNNRFVEFRGRKMSMAQLAEETGRSYDSIKDRLNRGLTPEQAVTIPITPGVPTHKVTPVITVTAQQQLALG